MSEIDARDIAIMAIDPGGTTGVAMGIFPVRSGGAGRTERLITDRLELDTCEVGGDYLEQAVALIDGWREFKAILKGVGVKRRPIIVMESFILRPGKASADPAQLMPVRVAAAFEALMLRRRRAGAAGLVEYQTPSQAKGYATDERLREWGLWKVGSAHERDALRHMAYRLHAVDR